jgi:O-acetyl-ADP-ribose deacetylase (regulator of RNase III)
LRKCYQTIFEKVVQYSIRSIAIPTISTGFYGFPKKMAASIAIEEILTFFQLNESRVVDRIILTAFNAKEKKAYETILLSLFEN